MILQVSVFFPSYPSHHSSSFFGCENGARMTAKWRILWLEFQLRARCGRVLVLTMVTLAIRSSGGDDGAAIMGIKDNHAAISR